MLPSGNDGQAVTATDPEEPMKFTPEEEKVRHLYERKGTWTAARPFIVCFVSGIKSL